MEPLLLTSAEVAEFERLRLRPTHARLASLRAGKLGSLATPAKIETPAKSATVAKIQPLAKIDHTSLVLSCFDRIEARSTYRDNRVSLADLLVETGLSLVELHTAVNSLRRQRTLTAEAYEGRHGADTRLMTASIREHDEYLAYVAKM